MPSAGGFRRRDWKLRLVRARLCARCVCVCEACVRARVRWLNRRQHSAHSLSATPPVSPRKPRVCDRPPGHVFPVLGEGSRPCRTVCRSLLRCQGRLAHQRPSALGPPPWPESEAPGWCSWPGGGTKQARSVASTPARGQRPTPRLASSHPVNSSF